MSVPALVTTNIGTIAYYRAPGCTKITLTDVLPYLSKIIHYADDGQGGAEYVDGEMLIYDYGYNDDTDDCQFCYVRIRADGWILAWQWRSDNSIIIGAGAIYVSGTVLQLGTSPANVFDYPKQHNKGLLKITASNPAGANAVGNYYSILNCNADNNYITVLGGGVWPAFQSGYSYSWMIYQTPASIVWWSHNYAAAGIPLFQSNTLFRAIWELWNVCRPNATITGTPSSSEAPFIQPSANYPGEYQQIIKCFQHDADVGYTDYTTEANNSTVSDTPIFAAVEAVGDAFYFGHDGQFDRLCYKMGQAGVGTVGITWEYWTGTAWTSYTPTVTYGDGVFKTVGNNIISAPGATTGWMKCSVNNYNAYWVRARLSSGDYTTQPLATQIWYRVSQNYSSDEYDIWNYEYASPLHILIAGVTSSIGLYSSQIRWLYANILSTKTMYFLGVKGSITGSGLSSKINDTELTISGPFKVVDIAKTPLSGTFAGVGNQIVSRTSHSSSSSSERLNIALLIFTT